MQTYISSIAGVVRYSDARSMKRNAVTQERRSPATASQPPHTCITIPWYCNMYMDKWLYMGFGLVTGLTGHLQFVITSSWIYTLYNSLWHALGLLNQMHLHQSSGNGIQRQVSPWTTRASDTAILSYAPHRATTFWRRLVSDWLFLSYWKRLSLENSTLSNDTSVYITSWHGQRRKQRSSVACISHFLAMAVVYGASYY
jgi:hypothetical protein